MIQGSSTPGGAVFYGLVDEFDRPIERTPQKWPYSYDGFVTWRGGKNEEASATLYSDRIIRESHEIYNDLCKLHFGDTSQSFGNRDPKKIEAFLRDWTQKPNLKLILVMEYCNHSTGYPTWRFDFHW